MLSSPKTPKYLMFQNKETLTKRWIPNYKLFFQLYNQIQNYFGTILNIPVNKIINQGYQELFVRHYLNIDKYRKFLEVVNNPYVIYNVSNVELDRGKLNQMWNSDIGIQQYELKNNYLFIQRNYLKQTLNLSIYCESREQLLQYLSYCLGVFDVPTGSMTVSYTFDNLPTNEDQEPIIFVDYITVINPTNFEDTSEYVFEERTYRLSAVFGLEGYVISKIRFFPKEETISQIRLFMDDFNKVERLEVTQKSLQTTFEFEEVKTEHKINLELLQKDFFKFLGKQEFEQYETQNFEILLENLTIPKQEIIQNGTLELIEERTYYLSNPQFRIIENENGRFVILTKQELQNYLESIGIFANKIYIKNGTLEQELVTEIMVQSNSVVEMSLDVDKNKINVSFDLKTYEIKVENILKFSLINENQILEIVSKLPIKIKLKMLFVKKEIVFVIDDVNYKDLSVFKMYVVTKEKRENEYVFTPLSKE